MFQKLLDFLFDLKDVSFTDSRHLHFTLAIEWPRFLIVIVCILLAVLGYWSYMRQTTTPNKRVTMGILRAITLVVLFLLFCRPQLVVDSTVPTPSAVAVWVDSSASFALEDPYKDPAMVDLVKRVTQEEKIDTRVQVRANRHQIAVHQLEQASKPGGWLNEVVKHQDVAFYSGGTSADRLGKVTALAPEDTRRDQNRGGVYILGMRMSAALLLLLIPVIIAEILLIVITRSAAAPWRIAWFVFPIAAVLLVGYTAILPPETQLASTRPELDNTQRMAAKTDELLKIAQAYRAIKPQAASTDVPAIIADIASQTTRENQVLSGIVLFSDGQTTVTGSRPDTAFTELARSGGGAQLFPVALGQADAPLDLSVSTPQMPAGVFVKDPVVVGVTVKWSGLDGPTRVKINLDRTMEDGSSRHLTDKTIDLPAGVGKRDVELTFRPDKELKNEKSETYKLVTRVTPVDALRHEELTLENNASQGVLRVFDAQMNVLYVEGYPRWEYRFLKTEFIRESTVNLSSLLLSADPEHRAEGDFIEDATKPNGYSFKPDAVFPETKEALDKYDVIMIGDVPPEFFSPLQMKLIADHVKINGAGLAWIAGNNSNPNAYANTPLGEFLPVETDDPNAPLLAAGDGKGFTLNLTPEGKLSNLFRMSVSGLREDDLKAVKELPELYWYKPVLRARRGAEVLATHPTRTDAGQPMPLLVTIPVGKGRVLYSAIRDTWRWRYYNGEPLFQTYWLQMARLLFHDRQMQQTNHRATLTSPKATIDVDGELHLMLNIKDPTLARSLGDRVRVNLKRKDSDLAVESLELSPTREDRFEGHITLRNPGQFLATMDATALAGEVDPVEVTVEPPSRERDDLTMNKQALERFAQRTGGVYNDPTTANASLIKKIPDRTEEVLRHVNEDLWYKPISLILIILLLTGEWLIRKSSGLI